MTQVMKLKDEMPPPARFGLVPQTMQEAIQLANMMATARLVPVDLQKSPADCLMVIQQAVRWDMDPFAVAQECSVIHGKLMHTGKLVAAVINTRGNLAERLSFEYKGKGEDRTIIVSGRLQGESTPRVIEVILKDAKTQNRVWQTQPDQQLMYHGTRVWARRHTPELMLGVYSEEEFDPRPLKLPPHDPDTGPSTSAQEIAEPPPSTGTSADQPAAAIASTHAAAGAAPDRGPGQVPDYTDYIDRWSVVMDRDNVTAAGLEKLWAAQEKLRLDIEWPDDDGLTLDTLERTVMKKAAALKAKKSS